MPVAQHLVLLSLYVVAAYNAVLVHIVREVNCLQRRLAPAQNPIGESQCMRRRISVICRCIYVAMFMAVVCRVAESLHSCL